MVEAVEPRLLFAVPSGFTEALIATGTTRPMAMAFAPDGRLFVGQKDGTIRVIKNNQLLSTPFASLSTIQTNGEHGLFGLAVDPNFASNKFVYVALTKPQSPYPHQVIRLTANGDVATSTRTTILELDPTNTSASHNSAALAFGGDGKLYITTGESLMSAKAAEKNNFYGKVIRINKDGSIPTDNPFYNENTGKYRAVWAYGLRNAFSFAVQPGTGRMFINDVGEAEWEEINEGRKGANYGWPGSEGPTTNPAYDTPFYAYQQNGVDAAITGGAFYNPASATFPSSYLGDYFFGDYARGVIRRLDTATKTATDFVTNADLVIDVDVAPDGSLWYLSRENTGAVYRVRSTTSSAPTITVQPGDQSVPAGQPATFTVEAGGTGPLSYQWQRNGSNIAGATSASYTLDSPDAGDDGDTFRVVVTNSAGSVTSRAATLTVILSAPPVATITLPETGTLWTAGGQLAFAGTGADPEDGTLPASAFTWKIDFHHDQHFHPFVDPYSGVTSDEVTLPDLGEVDPDVWYRIHLSVTDSDGVSDSTSLDVFPQKVNLALATEPAGLSLTLDGQPVAAPHATPAVVGLRRTIGAPAKQTLDGVVYEFDGWSDDATAAATREIITPGADVTYTARYKVSSSQVIPLRATADAYVRDGSHANTNFGAAAQIQVKAGAAGWNRQGYVRFDLASLGDGAVQAATLRVFGRLDNTQAPSVPVTVFGGPDGWSETGLTWNNKPAAAATQLASFTVVGTAGTFYDVDLTDYLKSKRAAGAAMATVVLKPGATARATVLLSSDEAAVATERPELIVRVGIKPDPDPAPTPVMFRAGADAHVRDGTSAGTNFGQAPRLEVKRASQTGWNREVYLRFDLGALATASSARLRLFGAVSAAGVTVRTSVYSAADTTWAESGITWNSRPPAGTTALATASSSGTADRWIEWDLTAFLQSELAAGRGVVTLVLRNLDASSAALNVASDEATTNRPELVVTA